MLKNFIRRGGLIFFVSFIYQEKKENEVLPVLSLGLRMFNLTLSFYFVAGAKRILSEVEI